MFLFCSQLQYILLWLKIDFKGLPVLMYAQFLVQECVYVQDTSFLHVLYQAVTVCDALCDDCLPRSFCYFFIFFFSFF